MKDEKERKKKKNKTRWRIWGNKQRRRERRGERETAEVKQGEPVIVVGSTKLPGSTTATFDGSNHEDAMTTPSPTSSSTRLSTALLVAAVFILLATREFHSATIIPISILESTILVFLIFDPIRAVHSVSSWSVNPFVTKDVYYVRSPETDHNRTFNSKVKPELDRNSFNRLYVIIHQVGINSARKLCFDSRR